MKKWSVKLPVAGYVVVEVKAENEKDAIDNAMQVDWGTDDVEELNTYDKMVQGNVVYVSPYEAEAEEIGDDD